MSEPNVVIEEAKHLRFPLPEGMAWRDVEDRDRSWLGQFTHRGPVVGIMTIRIRLKHEHHPELGEREVYSDNCGAAVWVKDLEERGADGEIAGFVWHWTEGNFGCGCNRTIFWHEAAGEPVPDEHPCDAPIRATWPEWFAEVDRGDASAHDFTPPWWPEGVPT